jgi:hypothetical protein
VKNVSDGVGDFRWWPLIMAWEDPPMSDDSGQQLDDEAAMATWAEIAPWIEHMAVSSTARLAPAFA